MSKIPFLITGSLMQSSDAAIVLGDEDPCEALIEAARLTRRTHEGPFGALRRCWETAVIARLPFS